MPAMARRRKCDHGCRTTSAARQSGRERWLRDVGSMPVGASDHSFCSASVLARVSVPAPQSAVGDRASRCRVRVVFAGRRDRVVARIRSSKECDGRDLRVRHRSCRVRSGCAVGAAPERTPHCRERAKGRCGTSGDASPEQQVSTGDRFSGGPARPRSWSTAVSRSYEPLRAFFRAHVASITHVSGEVIFDHPYNSGSGATRLGSMNLLVRILGGAGDTRSCAAGR